MSKFLRGGGKCPGVLSAVNDGAGITFLSWKEAERSEEPSEAPPAASSSSSAPVRVCSLNNAGTNDTDSQSEGPALFLCPRATPLLWERPLRRRSRSFRPRVRRIAAIKCESEYYLSFYPVPPN